MTFSEVLGRCTTYLFDCDGVLWHNSKLLPGALDLINHLIRSNRTVFLVTNNSTKSAEQYAAKCRRLGLPVTVNNIICSSNVAADYLSQHGIKGPVYVVGQEGVGLELDKCGISHFGIGPDPVASDIDFTSSFQLDPNTSGVLIGFDFHFNYLKLLKATSYICRGLPFFATNEDAQLPADGFVQPGTGSIVASVKVASGQNPVVMGKPNKPMFDFICRKHKIEPSKTVMVGDRLDTDILFGNNFGLLTVCVLTGITTEELLSQTADPKLKPSIVFPSVAELFQAVRNIDKPC